MKTRITELLGIKHPIMLSGMSYIAEPKLASAVCNAGGLGMLGIAHVTPEEARKRIREVRELTDKPFAINQTLNVPRARETIEVCIEEKVPVINYSLGRPWFVEQVHEYGGKVIGTVALVRHAIRAEQLGCDAISITGHEAAAHGGDVTSLVLTPLCASAVKVPLLIAGGFFDGRGLAAALVLGADGISMGTRLATTKESNLHEHWKQLILKATEQDTLYSDRFDGMGSRMLKTKVTEAMMTRRGVPVIRGLAGVLRVKRMLQLSWWDLIAAGFTKKNIVADTEVPRTIFQQLRFAGMAGGMERAINNGDETAGSISAGQCIGGIQDVPSVSELIERIVAEAEKVLEAAMEKVHA